MVLCDVASLFNDLVIESVEVIFITFDYLKISTQLNMSQVEEEDRQRGFSHWEVKFAAFSTESVHRRREWKAEETGFTTKWGESTPTAEAARAT